VKRRGKVGQCQNDIKQRVELVAQGQMEVKGKEKELNGVIDERRRCED
jgi:hypothetical protein